MKRVVLVLVLLLPLVWLPPVIAESAQDNQVASVRGYLKSQQTSEFSTRINPPLVLDGFRYESFPSTRSHCRCPYSVSVWDVSVFLSADHDLDGYYSELKLEIDLDLEDFRSDADVLVRVSLSYEGGSWNTLYNSGSINLTGSSRTDTYVIETRLENGYPAGIYDALIEVFDERSGDWLLSHGPNEDLALRTLPLESKTHASAEYHHLGAHTGYSVTAAGAVDWMTLLTLVCLLFSFQYRKSRSSSRSF